MIPITAQRRRGTELEQAILHAAWDELSAVGYAHLTMEGVAARAGTGKQVLYRRWPNRVRLVLAAVRNQLTSIADHVPDTGSVREDVLAVLRHMCDRFHELGPDLVNGIIAESEGSSPDFVFVMRETMMTVLKRGADRGEVRLDRVTARIATLPVDLLRHDLLLHYRTVDETTLAEITDTIFLPLIRA